MVNGEVEELDSFFDRFAMANMLVTIALLKNHTLVTKIRQAVLELVREQIRKLLGTSSDSDQESDDFVSAHLQNMNLDSDDGSEDGGEGSDIVDTEEDEEDESCRLSGFKLHSHDIFDYLGRNSHPDTSPTRSRSTLIKDIIHSNRTGGDPFESINSLPRHNHSLGT
jgi:hypothetical protein